MFGRNTQPKNFSFFAFNFSIQKLSLHCFFRSYNAHKILEGSNSGESPILMAHGLMGNKNNFNNLSKKLNEKTGRMVRFSS